MAYDGAPFRGFARSPDVTTVQSELEAALSQVLRHPVSIACAGRTDAGVHARGQAISFDADESHFEPVALDRAVNKILSPSIVVDCVEVAPADFDARLSCTGRTYRYHVLNRRVPDPLLHNLAWHVREPLDLVSMNLACDQIVGGRDFTTFSKRNKSRPSESFVRRVRSAGWTRAGDMVLFDVNANAFTHQMVRSLVGLFVDIGRGRRRAVDMGAALAAASRDAAPSPAPAKGLVFWQAHYDS